MISLNVVSKKTFMAALLTGDVFDSFLLQEATIASAFVTQIDGRVNTDFYPVEEIQSGQHPYEFHLWKDVKAFVYDLIKGKRTPTSLRFVLQLKPESALELLKKEYPGGDYTKLRALLIMIKFDGADMIITTGTSYSSFIMDKTADQVWDRSFAKFLGMKGIEAEVL